MAESILFLDHGELRVFAPDRIWGSPSDDIDDLASVRACVVRSELEQGSFRVVVDAQGSVPVGGVLELPSGRLAITSSDDFPEAASGIEVQLEPGRYRVAIDDELSDADAEVIGECHVRLQWVSDLIGQQPVCEQYGVPRGVMNGIVDRFAEALTALGEREGCYYFRRDVLVPSSAPLVQRKGGLWLESGSVNALPDPLVQAGWNFPTAPEGRRVRMWTFVGAQLLGIEAVLDEDGVPVHIAAAAGQNQPEDERVAWTERLMERMTEPLPIAELQPSVEPDGEIRLVWASDHVDVHVPWKSESKPTIEIAFLDDDDQLVDVATAMPLWKREGAWVYQLWLVGPRVGMKRAGVRVIG